MTPQSELRLNHATRYTLVHWQRRSWREELDAHETQRRDVVQIRLLRAREKALFAG
jgi:hypothetical protein